MAKYQHQPRPQHQPQFKSQIQTQIQTQFQRYQPLSFIMQQQEKYNPKFVPNLLPRQPRHHDNYHKKRFNQHQSNKNFRKIKSQKGQKSRIQNRSKDQSRSRSRSRGRSRDRKKNYAIERSRSQSPEQHKKKRDFNDHSISSSNSNPHNLALRRSPSSFPGPNTSITVKKKLGILEQKANLAKMVPEKISEIQEMVIQMNEILKQHSNLPNVAMKLYVPIEDQRQQKEKRYSDKKIILAQTHPFGAPLDLQSLHKHTDSRHAYLKKTQQQKQKDEIKTVKTNANAKIEAKKIAIITKKKKAIITNKKKNKLPKRLEIEDDAQNLSCSVEKLVLSTTEENLDDLDD